MPIKRSHSINSFLLVDMITPQFLHSYLHQCLTHGLIPHFYWSCDYAHFTKYRGVNALSGLCIISTETDGCAIVQKSFPCQCPLGLIPHFYSVIRLIVKNHYAYSVNALSGLYLISTFDVFCDWERFEECVNALSGLYLISTANCANVKSFPDWGVNALSGLYLISTMSWVCSFLSGVYCVNALSGLYLISTAAMVQGEMTLVYKCQCPLGLIPHFYNNYTKKSGETTLMCQCPLGLIPHFYGTPLKT